MARVRVVRVLVARGAAASECLGTLRLCEGAQVCTWRPYRSRTVETVTLAWLVGAIEWHCARAAAARRRLERSAARRRRRVRRGALAV